MEDTVRLNIYNPFDDITYEVDMSREDSTRITEDELFAVSVLKHAVACRKAKEIANKKHTADQVQLVAEASGSNYSEAGEVETGETLQRAHEGIENLVSLEEAADGDVLPIMAKTCDNYQQTSNEKHNWQYNEVVTLIQSYETHKDEFQHPKKRKNAWDNIVNDMLSNGHNVTIIHCRNKWNNLIKSYKTCVDNNKSTGKGASRFLFFAPIDEIMGKKPSISCKHTMSSLLCENNSTDESLEGASSPNDENVHRDTSDKNINPNTISKNFRKRKPTRLLESDRRNNDRVALQKESNELKMKLQKEKLELKKLFQEEKNNLRIAHSEDQKNLKYTLLKNRQEFNTTLQKEKMAAKDALLTKNLEVE